MNKVVILTGGSSGIGRATAELLRAQGCTVYEFSRRPSPEDPWHRSVDVTDGAAVKAATDEVFNREGRIDILVNNAGFGISGAMQRTSPITNSATMAMYTTKLDTPLRALEKKD